MLTRKYASSTFGRTTTPDIWAALFLQGHSSHAIHLSRPAADKQPQSSATGIVRPPAHLLCRSSSATILTLQHASRCRLWPQGSHVQDIILDQLRSVVESQPLLNSVTAAAMLGGKHHEPYGGANDLVGNGNGGYLNGHDNGIHLNGHDKDKGLKQRMAGANGKTSFNGHGASNGIGSNGKHLPSMTEVATATQSKGLGSNGGMPVPLAVSGLHALGFTGLLDEEVLLDPNRRPDIHDHERAVPAYYLTYLCVGLNASFVLPFLMQCLRIL